MPTEATFNNANPSPISIVNRNIGRSPISFGNKEARESAIMPIAINAPSSNSSGSAMDGGTGAPRTTTSRRGGRTRSRSPPVMGGRLSGASTSVAASVASAGAEHGVNDNPSSAAAAAAAAAKAFSTGSNSAPPNMRQQHQRPTSWPVEGVDSRSGGSFRSYNGTKPHYSGGSNWPVEDGRGSSSFRYEPPAGVGRYEGYPHRTDVRPSGGYNVDPLSHGRSGQPHSTQGAYPQDYSSRYNQRRGDARGNPKGPPRGGTSLVIGGTTPIHVPKNEEKSPPAAASAPSPSPSPSTARRQRGGSAASVFRGRPAESNSAAKNEPEDDGDEDSPQKILLSLRTPTTSFEEKDSSKKEGSLSLSPDDPVDPSKDPVFEKSPVDAKFSTSIEAAPSFSLFNQSFDSFGDGHYFNVDSSLHNDSFGIARVASVDQDATAQILQSTSAGNFSQQLLASGSGALTLPGYSPVNSFGNVSASVPRRTGSMMVVGGGSDNRASSPTQVLNVYRSYSSGGPRSGPLDDSHLRMSVGSFGTPSMAYSKSYGEVPPTASPGFYSGAAPPQDGPGSPPFYVFLRKHKNAFKDCLFLLPCLKDALQESSLDTEIDEGERSSSARHSKFDQRGDPTPQDTAVARRRVESSIFAFGGNPNRNRASPPPDKSSIFRNKSDSSKRDSVPVTPSSSSPTSRSVSRARAKYQQELPGRYYENESRLSWEFEETPPVEIGMDDDTDDKGDGSQSQTGANDDSKDRSRDHETKSSDDSNAESGRAASASPQPKMRYRCKLCGQPKQNHTCPYQQSLARSIGVMVFPSVNAFTADEPGTIAPALSEMNNFIDIARDPISNESSPGRPTPDRHRRVTTSATVTGTTQVTPESMRLSPHRHLHSPTSFATTPSGHSPAHRSGASGGGVVRNSMPHMSGRKRPYSHAMDRGPPRGVEQSDLLFMEAMEIKPEQFRLVTESKKSSRSAKGDLYSYPSLPLPYAQRKRLSDNLFSLSNEIPKLTDECAQVLREARERDQWDLAVAELMTQVVVILHCPDGDNRFEGLRQYLLTLGIAS